jgi:thymidylate synthase (FAD)
MKIIEPSAVMISPATKLDGKILLQTIENFARISHRSEDKQTEDSWRRFIQAVVIEHGDYSVIEHASASVIFRVDRGVTHELVRHRLFSFTQESTRFVNGRKSYPEGLEFIYPSSLSKIDNKNAELVSYEKDWYDSMLQAESTYFSMLNSGTRPQEARSVLPNALASTIAVTGNLRSWRHLFIMRTTKETHPDFRRIMIPLLKEFQERIPILYSDIEPEGRQIDNLKKAR